MRLGISISNLYSPYFSSHPFFIGSRPTIHYVLIPLTSLPNVNHHEWRKSHKIITRASNLIALEWEEVFKVVTICEFFNKEGKDPASYEYTSRVEGLKVHILKRSIFQDNDIIVEYHDTENQCHTCSHLLQRNLECH